MNAWKEQERTKKRSELSFEIMTRTAFVGTEIHNIYEWATIDFQSADIEQFIRGVVESKERERIRKLAPKIDDLDIYNTIAEFTFNDERLNTDLGFLVATVRVLNDCYDRLERRGKIDPSARRAEWHVTVVSIAHDLGWEWSKRIGNSTPIASSGCGFDKADFQNRVARIKKRLRPELELSGKSLSSGDEAKPRSADPVATSR